MRILPAALLLLAPAATAQEPGVSVDFERTPASAIARVLGSYWGGAVELDEEFEERPLTLKLEDVPVDILVKKLAIDLGGVVHESSATHLRILPRWKAFVFSALERSEVEEVGFYAARVGDLLAHLESAAACSFVLDPEADPERRVTVELKRGRPLDVLESAARQAGLRWRVRYGVVFLASEERMKALPVRAPWAGMVPRGRSRFDMDFEKTPLREVAARLSAESGVRVEAEGLGELPVTAHAAGVALPDALAILVLPRGFALTRRRGGVVIHPAEEGIERDGITVTYEQEDPRKVLEVLSTYTRERIELDPAFRRRRSTQSMDGVSLETALERIAAEIGAEVHLSQRGAYRLLPAWKARMLEKLEGSPLSLDAEDRRPIREILASLQRELRIPMVFDPGTFADPKVECRADRVPGDRLLDLLTEPNDLAWDLRYGVVFVCRTRRMNALPERAAFADAELTKHRIDVPFDETPVMAALAFLEAASGTAIEVDPDDREELRACEVTFQAVNVDLRHALAVTLLPHGFTAEVTEDGRVAVRRR